MRQRSSTALPVLGSRAARTVPRPWKLPLNRLSGPWPLGRFDAGLQSGAGSSLKAAVRTVFDSWFPCAIRRSYCNGETELHKACRRGSRAVANVLIAAKADLNATEAETEGGSRVSLSGSQDS